MVLQVTQMDGKLENHRQFDDYEIRGENNRRVVNPSSNQ